MTDATGVAVRPAEPADAARIAALLTDEGYPAGATDILLRLERFREPESQVRVAELDGEVLGFIALHLVPRFEHGDRVLRVVAMVIDPAARGRGVGQLLVADAEAIGRNAGTAFAELTVGHHRPEARRFFEEAGYDASLTTYLRKRL